MYSYVEPEVTHPFFSYIRSFFVVVEWYRTNDRLIKNEEAPTLLNGDNISQVHFDKSRSAMDAHHPVFPSSR